MKALTQIACGSLAGATSPDGAIAQFKGIPYAKPLVGALRWKPPQRPTPWPGTRQAVQFGPGSIQILTPKNSFYSMDEDAMSEDCLYLNVYTGGLDPAERRPVIVWFHFGAFNFGWSASPLRTSPRWLKRTWATPRKEKNKTKNSRTMNAEERHDQRRQKTVLNTVFCLYRVFLLRSSCGVSSAFF